MEQNKMTVVIVNDFDYVQGGATKVALDTAQILYENNINVVLFSAVHKKNNYMFKQVCTNQKECINDGIKGAFRGLYNKKAEREFSKLLDTLDKNTTIIHVHGWTKALSSSIFKVAYRKKFKTVLTLHDYFTACPNGGYFDYRANEICHRKPMGIACMKCNCDSRNYAFKIYRYFREIIQNYNMKSLKNYIGISDFSINILRSTLPKDSNIVKIYNPIDIKENIERVKAEDNKDYLFLGRVSKEKGIDIFCEAVSELCLPAIVVGDGELFNEYKEKYANIKFVGWKTHDESMEYIKTSKVLLFTSKWYEGAGLTIMEAKGHGVPCIVSNLCAGTEFIAHSIDGLIFDGTCKDLKKKIVDYEKSDISKFSRSAYDAYWINRHDKKAYFMNLNAVYKDIL